VAKKAGLSTRTFERGKRILEDATEEDKQRLRDGKASISKVYQEIVSPGADVDNWQENVPAKLTLEDLQAAKNRAALMELLEKLNKNKLFCPVCKHNMFECSSCHKTLRDSVGETP